MGGRAPALCDGRARRVAHGCPRIGRAAGASALIEVAGEPKREVALSADGTFSVRGPIGETVLEVSQGGIRVLSSPCPRKTCVRTGPVSRPGEMIVCVPNEVVVVVAGGGEREIDAVTR